MEIQMKTRVCSILLTSLMALVIIQVLLGCGPSSVISPPVPSDSTTVRGIPSIIGATASVEPGSSAASYRTAQSVSQLVSESAIIVIGQMTGIGETFNMARSPQNPSQPDPAILGLGQVYHFQVERYLKGQGSRSIEIAQVEAILGDQTPKTPKNIARARASYGAIPLRPNVRYLYFLRPLTDFPDKPNYFVGTLHPDRFVLGEQGNSEPETPSPEAKRVFRAKPSSELIGEVEFWVSGGKFPAPTMAPTPLRPLSTPTRSPYP